MKLNLVITIVLSLSAGITVNGAKEEQNFDRSGFYAALASESLDTINAELASIAKLSLSTKEAFEGTLLIRKAGLVFNPGSKLSLFKSGHKKLDNAIVKESSNAELRFLRLMIQENVPRILNYRKEIDEDSKVVRSSFKSLPAVVQKEIVNYSKTSKVLNPGFF